MCEGRLLLGSFAGRERKAHDRSISLSENASRSKKCIGDFHVDTNSDPILSLDFHRYPDSSHPKMKGHIAEMRGLPSLEHVVLGVSSDEVIDLLVRIYVAPGREKILITPPTYGMYAVCVQVNDVGITRVNLELSADGDKKGDKGRFSLRVVEVHLVLVFFPRGLSNRSAEKPHWNPNLSGNNLNHSRLRTIQRAATPIVEYANLYAMQTLSKSFGLAGIWYMPLLSPRAFLIHPHQTWYSAGAATPHPDPVEYQGAIKHTAHLPRRSARYRVRHYSDLHDPRDLGLGRAIGARRKLDPDSCAREGKFSGR
ncbi:hypothetical protein BJY52DRAFT_1223252 [Lactarius psammicola]|nr:hypothetical protein BJY52DRAFT_1223252 [Lactarius psammicola]